MNKLCINGRLIKDPELKQLENNNSLCTFFIANDVYSGGNKKTGFYKCTAFGKLAQSIAEYARTGRELFITGRLDQYSYQDQAGKKNSITGILVDQFDFGAFPKSASKEQNQKTA
ncbi:MAG: single-stranded DNA-binding protein [Spirochaetes bacterium]|jgi:single-strand DNA-binding protein|nr:single-stranded DNA-binding protein [Spirochaetota bacterium]